MWSIMFRWKWNHQAWSGSSTLHFRLEVRGRVCLDPAQELVGPHSLHLIGTFVIFQAALLRWAEHFLWKVSHPCRGVGDRRFIPPTQLRRKSWADLVEKPSAKAHVHFGPRALEAGIRKQTEAPEASWLTEGWMPWWGGSRGQGPGPRSAVPLHSWVEPPWGWKMACFQWQSAKKQEGSFGAGELGNPLAKSREIQSIPWCEIPFREHFSTCFLFATWVGGSDELQWLERTTLNPGFLETLEFKTCHLSLLLEPLFGLRKKQQRELLSYPFHPVSGCYAFCWPSYH